MLALTDLSWYGCKYRKDLRSCACYSNNQILIQKLINHPMGTSVRTNSLGYYPTIHAGVNWLSEDPVNGALESGILKLLARRLGKLVL